MLQSDQYALLTPHEMAAADQATITGGVAGLTLMEAAGREVAQAVQARWSPQKVVVLCGPGNNGGDGFVAARYLAQAGWPVTVALLGALSSLKGDAAYHAALWEGSVISLTPAALDAATLVIDALWGAGLARPIEGVAAEVLQAVVARQLPVCAVDIPSGVDGATGAVQGMAAPAQLTVTFFRKKPGHVLLPGRTLCGEVICTDIGIPASVLAEIAPQAYENAPSLWQALLPWPQVGTHKYARGHVLILGGALLTGAARLAARAAARVGAGVVTIAVPRAVWPVYASALTSIMVQPLDQEGDFEMLLQDTRKNVIALGPGAGVSTRTQSYVLAVLATQRAVVLDADAITSFAQAPQLLFDALHDRCVLTPHEGEFGRVFACTGDKLTRARAAARVCGAVILLKGADTVIAAPDGQATVINTNGGAELATAGSGDVLTGLIAGWLALGMRPFDAACAGAWVHGAAAALYGPGLLAEDLPEKIPRVLRRLKKSVNF